MVRRWTQYSILWWIQAFKSSSLFWSNSHEMFARSVVVCVDELKFRLSFIIRLILMLGCHWSLTYVYKGLTKPYQALVVVAQKAIISAFLKAMSSVTVMVIFLIFFFICWIFYIIEVSPERWLSIALVAVPVVRCWSYNLLIYMSLILSFGPSCFGNVFTSSCGFPRDLLLLWHLRLDWLIKLGRICILEHWNISRHVSWSIESINMLNKLRFTCTSLILIICLVRT